MSSWDVAGHLFCRRQPAVSAGHVLYLSEGRSAATGLYLTCYYLGGSIGAVAPAPLYAHHGWLSCAVLIGLVALASTALARVAWQETVVDA